MTDWVVKAKINGTTVTRIVGPGEWVEFHYPSPYLVSAGQSVDLEIMGSPVGVQLEPGSLLGRAEHIAGVVVAHTHDYSFIPSNRPLWEILQDVVRHTLEFPTHGAMCVCMDQFSREIRMHLRKAMPPDTRVLSEDVREEQHVIQQRVIADHRIHHVLQMVLRNF